MHSQDPSFENLCKTSQQYMREKMVCKIGFENFLYEKFQKYISKILEKNVPRTFCFSAIESL